MGEKEKGKLKLIVNHRRRIRRDDKFQIGEMLLEAGHITRRMLDEAVDHVDRCGGHLGSYLLHRGHIGPDTIPRLLSAVCHLPVVNTSKLKIAPDIIARLPFEVAVKYLALPLESRNGIFRVAMTEPNNKSAVDEIRAVLGRQVEALAAAEKDIIESYRKYYHVSPVEIETLTFGPKRLTGPGQTDQDLPDMTLDLEDFNANDLDLLDDFDIGPDDYFHSAGGEDPGIIEPQSFQQPLSLSDNPVVALVDKILTNACHAEASHVHLEPFEQDVRIRFRKEGRLYEDSKIQKVLFEPVAARIKVLSSMNIYEKRVPQQGRLVYKSGRKEIEFQSVTCPSPFGESIVLKVKKRMESIPKLSELGLNYYDLAKVVKAMARPYGLVLVTGPGNSGKTTTMHSALLHRNAADMKILTAEKPPLKNKLPGISQVEVRSEYGMSYARVLEDFFIMDPDICLVGEISDLATARAAAEGAMQGALVLGAMPTYDCPSTITHLLSMGLFPFVAAQSIGLVISQRLLRRICPKCKTPARKIKAEQILEAGFDESEVSSLVLYKGRGCAYCQGVGYKGRIGVFEVMELTRKVRETIRPGVTEAELRTAAVKEGMNTLRQNALFWCKQGLTTIEEALRHTLPLP